MKPKHPMLGVQRWLLVRGPLRLDRIEWIVFAALCLIGATPGMVTTPTTNSLAAHFALGAVFPLLFARIAVGLSLARKRQFDTALTDLLTEGTAL